MYLNIFSNNFNHYTIAVNHILKCMNQVFYYLLLTYVQYGSIDICAALEIVNYGTSMHGRSPICIYS